MDKNISSARNILIGLLLFLAAIFIFTSLRSMRTYTTDESAAIDSLRAINKAMEDWYLSRRSYVEADLKRLGEAYPQYIDSQLAGGIKSGYSFMLMPLSEYDYLCMATPLSSKENPRVLRITKEGAIEAVVGDGWQRIE